ncbi:hypothetical protein EIP86_009013 [Pleurotus ostreatoroseus]|nr:hypothetical protein EIP86_009013 [Pleurotus ostreatoroseus]
MAVIGWRTFSTSNARGGKGCARSSNDEQSENGGPRAALDDVGGGGDYECEAGDVDDDGEEREEEMAFAGILPQTLIQGQVAETRCRPDAEPIAQTAAFPDKITAAT